WTTAGGDFNPTASATTTIPNVVGLYTWSSAQMIADVQAWVTNGAVSFGWILRSNEATNQTTNRFSSRTNPTVADRPKLTVTYTLPIPVKLISFTGQETKYGNALSWETAQETNNAFFSIDHSLDGLSYSSIGKVAGAGTTSMPQKYTFLHNAPSPGQHYYRLAQTDIDGKINYSPVVALNQKKEISHLRVSPNPVKDRIVFPGFAPGKQSFMVFDYFGKKIMQGVLMGDLRIPSTLPAGTYYLRVVQDDGRVLTGNFIRE
ncbi:MAG TPA: hypothetical protein VK498_11910, partial [Ferruginibacter sp.]|nr:hypothetical protein [Ferruginibacter sp.]